MSHPESSATNMGVEYQNWFLALQIAYSFFEPNRVIYPENFKTPIDIIDDIKVVENRQSTFYNIKQISSAKSLHWNNGALKKNCVIEHIKQQFEADTTANIVFVSQSNCYLFTEVFQRAVNALTIADLNKVLASDHCSESWESAKDEFNYDDARLLALARKVTMRCLPLYEIKKLIEHRFVPLGHHQIIGDIFFAKAVECSARKTRITKELINLWLEEKSISFKPNKK